MLLRPIHLASEETPPFELKGSLFTLTVLHLFQMNRAAVERHLAEKVKQAPGFFNNTPVVIDLEGMTDSPDGWHGAGRYPQRDANSASGGSIGGIAHSARNPRRQR